MKKAILAMTIAVGAALTGCSQNQAVSAPSAPSSEAQSIYVMQEGDIQVTGEVTEIIGNEVTLALGDVSENQPQRELPDDAETPDGEEIPQIGNEDGFPQGENGGGFPQRENGEGFSGRDFGEGFQRGDGEGFPQREGGDGFSQQRGNNQDSPQMGGGGRNRSSSATIEKSGETASYIIPVGMTVTGANGRNNDYSSISAGMILRLTINVNGYVAAAEIL